MTPRPRLMLARRFLALALFGVLMLATGRQVVAQQTGIVFPIQDPNARVEARQVTLCGVVATPGGTIDPRLASIQPQLSKLLPGYGFRLLGVETKRLTADQSLSCALGEGMVAGATLVQPTDENGKVHLRVSVSQNHEPLLDTQVHTPVNQLFYCDKVYPDGSRLLICIGAR